MIASNIYFRSFAYDVFSLKCNKLNKSFVEIKAHQIAICLFKLMDFLRLMTYFLVRDTICNCQTVWIKTDGTKITGAWNIAKQYFGANQPKPTLPFEPNSNQIIIRPDTPIEEAFITLPYLEISRLGDYARFYWNAKILASKLGVPIVLRPFPQSNMFKLSEIARYCLDSSLQTTPFTRLTPQQAKDIYEGKLTAAQLGKGIFSVPYFWEWKSNMKLPENHKIREDFIADFQPIKKVEFIEPIAGKINIAIHVRDGGTFDNLFDKFLYPDRFPDISYYEAQLRYVLNLPEHQGQEVHVQIFTDAVNPEQISKHLEEIARTCGPEGPTVTFGFTPPGRSEDEAALSDIISLSRFPIVIRAVSGFSDLSMAIGQPSLDIVPCEKELNTENRSVSITQVRRTRRNAEEETVSIEHQKFTKSWPGSSWQFRDVAKRFETFFTPARVIKC